MQRLIPKILTPRCSAPIWRQRGRFKHLLVGAGLATMAIGWSVTAFAGDRTYNFNPPNGDPNAQPGFVLFGANVGGAWQQTGGASGGANDGFLQITPAANGTDLGVLFPQDFYTNADGSTVALPLDGFNFDCDVRVGNATGNNGRPADGFSISFAAANDPVIYWANQDTGNFRGWAGGDSTAQALEPASFNYATGVGTMDPNPCDSSTAENGTKTGVSVQFDTWQGNTIIDQNGQTTGGNDNVGWRVHFNGKMIDRIYAYINGDPNQPVPGGSPDPGGADVNGIAVCPKIDANFDQDPVCKAAVLADTNTIETGTYSASSMGSDSNLLWAHLSMSVTTNTHLLTVTYKGRRLVDNVQLTNFTPYVGQIVMGGRTGGANENRDVDNVHIVTYASVQAVINGISTASAYVRDFSVQLANIGPAMVTNVSKVLLDGVDVTTSANTTVTLADPFSTITYSIPDPANYFVAGSAHKVTVTYSDALAHTTTGSLSFIVTPWKTLTTAMSVPAASVDTTKPGFNVLTYQTPLGQFTGGGVQNQDRVMEDSVRRSEEQLAGLLGANASSNGNSFVAEANVINYTINPAATQGHFNTTTDPADPAHYAMTNFPGIPVVGTGDPTTDNLAAEINGVLFFPDTGVYSFTVTSDDGFHLWIGNPAKDVFNSVKPGEFDGGRGWSDTTFAIYATNGYYPYRLVYENGGGDASLEFIGAELSPNPTTNVLATVVGTLVNDPTVQNSIKSYRVTTAPAPAAVSFITPVPAHGIYEPNGQIAANITDGSDGAIQAGSVKLLVNGAAVSPTITKNGNVTQLTYTPAPILPRGSNNLSIAFTDASNHSQSNFFTFNVRGYVVIPPSLALPASVVDKTKSGFLEYGYQATPHGPGDTDTGNGNFPNSTFTAELEQHGFMGWSNTMDLTLFTGPGDPTLYGARGTYVEDPSTLLGGTINYSGGGTGNNGNFPDGNAPDMPGLPSPYTTFTPTDNSDPTNNNMNCSLDIQTVLDLQPGLYRIGVNSDDGFNLTFGNPAEWATFPLSVVSFDGGRGASDSTSYFYITQAGLYPIRVLWYNGGGGLNIEFYTQHAWPDRNWHVLVNDVLATYNDARGNPVNPAIKSYQYPIGKTKGSPYISSYGPAQFRPGSAESIQASTHTGFDAPVYANLEDGETAVDPSTVKLWVDGAPVTPTVNKTGTTTAVNYKPSSQWTANTNHTVQLSYLDRTVSWTFQVENHPNATFFIEAEDFNFGGGQTMAAASTMPYYGGAYAGQSAVHGVDYYRSSDDNHGAWYRLFPTAGQNPVPFQINHDLDRGVNELHANQRIGWIGGVQWYNYTRTFPSGNYNVYAGMGQGDAAGTHAHARYGVLQMVDSPTTPTVTNSLGVFDGFATGNYGQNGGVGQAGGQGLVPMTDGNGNMVAINLSGTKTLRFYLPSGSTNETITINGNTFSPQGGSGDYDFLMFTPVGNVVTTPKISVNIVNGKPTITFEGTLLFSPTANGTYQPVTGASNPYTVTQPGTAGFYKASF